jgi:SNF2 family DNA or RNA helicase
MMTNATNMETYRLDLTVANHAFLIEPQWNPMLEEQAMSRVHRIGQTKAVSLVRLIVKKTWEEKIVTAQERKRTLADMIMEGSRLKSGDDGRNQLLVCRIQNPSSNTHPI